VQEEFLNFQQNNNTILKYKQLFLHRFNALKNNKMSLGAVEAMTDKYTSGTAAVKKEKALEQYAAMVAIRNA